jgi:hypothetical protein
VCLAQLLAQAARALSLGSAALALLVQSSAWVLAVLALAALAPAAQVLVVQALAELAQAAQVALVRLRWLRLGWLRLVLLLLFPSCCPCSVLPPVGSGQGSGH